MTDIQKYYAFDKIQDQFRARLNERLRYKDIQENVTACYDALNENNPAKLFIETSFENLQKPEYVEKVTVAFHETKEELDFSLYEQENTCAINAEKSSHAIALWKSFLPDRIEILPPEGYLSYNPDHYDSDKTLYRMHLKNNGNLTQSNLDTKKTYKQINQIASDVNEILMPEVDRIPMWGYAAFTAYKTFRTPVPPSIRDDGLIDPAVMLVNSVFEDNDLISNKMDLLKRTFEKNGQKPSLKLNSWGLF